VLLVGGLLTSKPGLTAKLGEACDEQD